MFVSQHRHGRKNKKVKKEYNRCNVIAWNPKDLQKKLAVPVWDPQWFYMAFLAKSGEQI